MSDRASRPIDSADTQASAPRTASAAPTVPGVAAEKATVLGDFRLVRKLGQGGMGAVYLAHQISLDRPCALKILSRDLADRPGFVDRFKREARAMARIDHPNVVKCYAVGEARGLHFVAMELIDGRSMQDWLNDLNRLSVPDALHVTLLCADALKHAHGLNMVHRDVKPDNILVTSKGAIRVSDLGLAKVLDEDMSMTQSGTGLGTPHYMPPEQARNAKHVDHRSDIYALGSTLYHFLTGQTPFKGETIVELITAKERGSFTHAKRLNPEIPERLDLMIDKAMARDPQHRYQSMAEFIRDLESLHLAGESLSFIKAADREVMRRGGGGTTSPFAGTRPGFSAPTNVPLSEPAVTEELQQRKRAARDTAPRWYVRHSDGRGKQVISRWTTEQVVAAIKSDQLDASARVARDPREPFLPFAQFPEFAAEARKFVTRTKIKAKEHSLARQYAKLEQQYRRRRWWRLLARVRDGTLGIVGLILYLALVVAIIGGAIWGGLYLWDYLKAENLLPIR